MEIKFKKFFILLTILSTLETKHIFMSTEGNDETGDGSIDNPYLSLMKCQEVAESGDIVYIRGGTYTNIDIATTTNTYNYIFHFTKSGITYKAYNSENVIFDFEFLPILEIFLYDISFRIHLILFYMKLNNAKKKYHNQNQFFLNHNNILYKKMLSNSYFVIHSLVFL